MAKETHMQRLLILLTSRNKNAKKLEKKSEWPSANPGGGYSSQHKKVKPVKGSFPRNFPKFKVANKGE